MFAQFANTPYTFLVIDQLVEGNTISAEYDAVGVFKLRSGMVQIDNMEQQGSGKTNADATLHIKATESFTNDLVGNGVRVNNIEYRITDCTEGKDFDSGEVEFYRAVLKRESFAWQQEEPLE